MRERIERIGGRLTMVAGTQAGVVLRFVIPAQLAYRLEEA